MLYGAPPAAPTRPEAIEDALRTRLAGGADKRSAIAEVAAELSVPKRQVYDVATRL